MDNFYSEMKDTLDEIKKESKLQSGHSNFGIGLLDFTPKNLCRSFNTGKSEALGCIWS